MKAVKLKLILKEEARDFNVKKFQKNLKDTVKIVADNNIKVFFNNNLEIVFQLTHEINLAVAVLDNLIVYLRESVKNSGSVKQVYL